MLLGFFIGFLVVVTIMAVIFYLNSKYKTESPDNLDG